MRGLVDLSVHGRSGGPAGGDLQFDTLYIYVSLELLSPIRWSPCGSRAPQSRTGPGEVGVTGLGPGEDGVPVRCMLRGHRWCECGSLAAVICALCGGVCLALHEFAQGSNGHGCLSKLSLKMPFSERPAGSRLSKGQNRPGFWVVSLREHRALALFKAKALLERHRSCINTISVVLSGSPTLRHDV